MSVLTPLPTLDDNMDLGSPSFFNSAWHPDLQQSDYPFTQGYQLDMETHSSYTLTPQYHELQAENSQVDYFSAWQHHFTGQQQYFSSRYKSFVAQSNDDSDTFFGSSGSSLSRHTTATQPGPTLYPLRQASDMQGSVSYTAPAAFFACELGNPPVNAGGAIVTTSSPIGSESELANEGSKGPSLCYKFTPEDSLPPLQKDETTPASKHKQDETALPAPPLKVKKARKSRKKPLTKEQEEAKRKKFLKMNRVAANKCRKNQKKWIDDLQAKAKMWSDKNEKAKSVIQGLEEELAILKSAAFIHSRHCDEKDMAAWIEGEARRVQKLGKVQVRSPKDAGMSAYGQGVARQSSSRS
jgi:hypothetical protein